MLLLFLKALVLGVIITAPLGPIGMLCINRTLERGFLAGFTCGLGTAIGDASYALVAVAGLSIVADTLRTLTLPLSLIGGVLLIWLGVRGLKQNLAEAADIGRAGLVATTIGTFLLTISNPATILSFGALFAGFGLLDHPGAVNAAVIVAGVFAGSLAWWFLLSGTVSLARDRLSANFTTKISRGSSYLLIVFGIVALGSAAYSIF